MMIHDDVRIACAAHFSCFQGQPLDYTIKVAIPIFNATFPSCQAVFLFDNAFNHSTYAADAIRVENMNLHPGGKQGVLREGFMHHKGP